MDDELYTGCALKQLIQDLVDVLDALVEPDSIFEKPYSLRLKVFERDGWKCRICGKTRDDGALLEADHIIPVSAGGQTKIENLQTLCRECNNGKGKRILNSFPGND